ncbi:hypothetical protein BD310DRAFT_104785 [Dichomitus squalens]|uniref:Uncharacterized protein n=1 Tax=Dichomitus squalens TaxID=114155 RepID=A0A4Q9PJ29_9APHY|nr:hypothetical protein BD310DRAFT_104785 [Dichomitus squalens]
MIDTSWVSFFVRARDAKSTIDASTAGHSGYEVRVGDAPVLNSAMRDACNTLDGASAFRLSQYGSRPRFSCLCSWYSRDPVMCYVQGVASRPSARCAPFRGLGLSYGIMTRAGRLLSLLVSLPIRWRKRGGLDRSGCAPPLYGLQESGHVDIRSGLCPAVHPRRARWHSQIALSTRAATASVRESWEGRPSWDAYLQSAGCESFRDREGAIWRRTDDLGKRLEQSKILRPREIRRLDLGLHQRKRERELASGAESKAPTVNWRRPLARGGIAIRCDAGER